MATRSRATAGATQYDVCKAFSAWSAVKPWSKRWWTSFVGRTPMSVPHGLGPWPQKRLCQWIRQSLRDARSRSVPTRRASEDQGAPPSWKVQRT